MTGIPKYKRKKYIEMSKVFGFDENHCSCCDEDKGAEHWTLFACNLPYKRLTLCDCDYSCLCLERCNDCVIQDFDTYLAKKQQEGFE